MTLRTYRIFAKREEYYCTEVEARTEEEAWEQYNECDCIDWEPLLEGGEFESYDIEEAE